MESQQFTPTQGCGLRVITVGLEGGKLYRIKITDKGNVADAGDDVLRFLWWSTTQQMGLVIKERMYPVTQYDEMIQGVEYTDGTVQVEEDHVAYTNPGTYALYSGIDFGEGGTMELRLDSPGGPLLGTMDFTPTGDWAKYEEQTLELNQSLSGVHNICLVFKPTSDFLFNYTTFTFEAEGQTNVFDKWVDVATPIYHLGLEGADSTDNQWNDYRYVAQEIVPSQANLHGSKGALNLTAGKATVHMEFRKEVNGQALAVCEQPIESKGNGVNWYEVTFNQTVTVEPYQTYYLVYYLTERGAGNIGIAHGANVGAGMAKHPGYVWKMTDGQPVVYAVGETNLVFGFELISAGEDPAPTTYVLSFDTDGGSTVASQTLAEGAAPASVAAPVKAGYTFEGWYNGNTRVELADFTMPANHVTLIARWTQNTVPVTPAYGDVNGDNTIDAKDALLVLQKAVDKIDRFPVE